VGTGVAYAGAINLAILHADTNAATRLWQQANAVSLPCAWHAQPHTTRAQVDGLCHSPPLTRLYGLCTTEGSNVRPPEDVEEAAREAIVSDPCRDNHQGRQAWPWCRRDAAVRRDVHGAAVPPPSPTWRLVTEPRSSDACAATHTIMGCGGVWEQAGVATQVHYEAALWSCETYAKQAEHWARMDAERVKNGWTPASMDAFNAVVWRLYLEDRPEDIHRVLVETRRLGLTPNDRTLHAVQRMGERLAQRKRQDRDSWCVLSCQLVVCDICCFVCHLRCRRPRHSH
jgi:hypothetical protein